MEDELKDACNEFLVDKLPQRFRNHLKLMLDAATMEQLEDLAETILFGLGQDRSH